MKTTLFVIIAIILIGLLENCTPEPTAEIKFCDSIDASGNCINESDTFPMQKVFVDLESSVPFETKKVTGNLYTIRDGKEVQLSFKEFAINPGDKQITQSLPFQEFGWPGNYLVKFFDDKDSLIAEKSVRVNK